MPSNRTKCPYIAGIAYELSMQCFIHHGSFEMFEAYHGIIECSETGEPAGFAIYSKLVDMLLILKLGVLPTYRREKIGSRMIRRLKAKKWPVTAYVNQYNLPAQLFFQANGFKAISMEGLHIAMRTT